MKTIKLSFILLLICSSVSAQSIVPMPQGYVDMGLPSGTRWKQFSEDNKYLYKEAINKFGNNIPTKQQCQELIENCTWERFNNLIRITSKINGNEIFMYPNLENHDFLLIGCFWTSNTYYYDNEVGYLAYTIDWSWASSHAINLRIESGASVKHKYGVHLVYNPQ